MTARRQAGWRGRSDPYRRPLDLDGETQGMVSLDHSAGFHRPARADECRFYDASLLWIGPDQARCIPWL